MTDRSLAQLRWHGGRLGVMLVNEHNQRFFVFAEKLKQLFEHPGKARLVKVRDRDPRRATAHYPGEVQGCLTFAGDDATLAFVVGGAYHGLPLNDDGTLPNEYFLRIEFILPRRELTLLHDVAVQMESQRTEFEERLQSAEATPLLPIPRKIETAKPSADI